MKSKKSFFVKSLIVSFFTASVILFSCNKDNDLSQKEIQNENYLNYTGAEHNRLLALLQKNDEKGRLSYSQMYDIIVTDLGVQNNPPISKEKCIELLTKYNNFDYNTKLDQLYLDGLITDKQKSKIIETYNVVKSPVTLETKQIELNSIEDYILNDQTMTTNESETLMVFMSVSKSSLEYWDSEFTNEKAKWWHIVLADAIGGGTGFGIGGPIGGIILGAMASYEMSLYNEQ